MAADRLAGLGLVGLARRYREDGVALLKRAFGAADMQLIADAYDHLAADATGKKMELAHLRPGEPFRMALPPQLRRGGCGSLDFPPQPAKPIGPR